MYVFSGWMKRPVRIDVAMVRWVQGASFGLEFTEIRSAQWEHLRALIMKTKLEKEVP